MALTATGLGSGLDVDGIVTQLMALEKRSVSALDKQEAGYKSQLSAYGSLKGALSALQTAANAVATPGKFRAAKATVGDATLVSASASAGAATGAYDIEVQELAQAQKLRSGPLASGGTGTITIEFGKYAAGAFSLNPDKTAKTITVSQGSLGGTRDAINAANAGVRASIVNDGSGDRLVLSVTDTGEANALRIAVDDNDGNDTDAAGLSFLAYDASAGGVSRLAESAQALDARVVIDGVTVTSASNTVSGAVEGLSLTLKKKAVGTTTTVSVARDVDGAKAAVDAFIAGYNTAAKALKTLSSYDTATKTAATLQGDSTLVSVQARLRSALSAVVDQAGGYDTLSSLGISFLRDGTLSADSGKLRAALEDAGKDPASALAAFGVPTDAQVAYSSATSAAEAGIYALNVTQLAAQGNAVGSAPAGLTITAGVNDTLQVSVDGVAKTATLPAGTYTAAALATLLQSRIEGVKATESGGVLTLTSATWGATSTVTVTGGNAAADLFGTALSTAGINAAGTLNGFAATGAGQNLSAKGLTVTVTGGATGARGTVRFSRGIADRVAALIGEALNDAIGARTDGIAKSMRTLEAKRETLNARLETVEKRYRAQFIALDKMMNSMNGTSSYLAQQLQNLPGSGGR